MVFVAEKAGKILVYENLRDETPELFKDLRTETYDHGDRGLLGLAIDPEFPTKPYVYALFTYDHILGETEPPPKWGQPNHTGDSCPVVPENEADDCLVSGRLVRYKAEFSESEGHLHAVAGEEKALIPEEWCQQFSSHSIGDLRFGPEGALYASAGDGASFTNTDYGQYGFPDKNPCGDPPGGYGNALEPETSEGGSFRSQALGTLDGKIIRIDPETGAAYPGNPLAANPSPNARRIVAEGFRNPFRFTLDPVTGELYTDNVGSSEIEELDHFAAPPASVFNSGWPCYEGPEKQFLFKLLKNRICERLYAEPGSTSAPLFYYSHGQSVVPNDECPFEFGSALGGISFYEGEQFPSQYKGALFFTDTVRGCVYVMFPGANGRPDPSTTMRFMRESRIYPAVDIQEGPEGALYYVDLFGDEEYGDGAVHKITYDPGAPTARLKAAPPYGAYNGEGKYEVTVDATESSDPQGEPLIYEWDLDGNGSFETSGGTTGKKSIVFTQKEEEERKEHGESLYRVVAVRVKDGEGNTSVARVTIYPGDTPPAPRIDSPGATLKWGVGDKIVLHGSAVDQEEGEGPNKEIFTPLSYYWSTRILHCPTGPNACHAHPLQIFAGTRSGELIAPEHDYPSYIEITLRVADRRGLAASKTIKLEPRTVSLSIDSSPPGIELTAGLAQAAAPFSLTAIEGSHVLLSAPEAAQLGGRAYTFRDWSDGGARIHTILANSSTQLVANYTTPESAPPPSGEPPRDGSPATILRKHPAAKTRSRTAKFSFTASVTPATFRCRLDRRAWVACRSPKAYRGLKRGRHVFEVRATASGLSDPTPARFRWKILGGRAG